MQKIITHLWFDNQAEEAARFYTSIFKNSKVGKIMRYGEAGSKVAGKPKGSVMTVAFRLEGQEFVALNGGPIFKFSPAISLFVNCNTQKEIDTLWAKLSAGGEIQQCGWLTDKYGVTWQIVPTVLGKMLADKNAERAERVMNAMLKMKKLEIKPLKQAYNARG
jgi:predicted 3-demethylubiquinone-9 3-methyltransferase (glyoxalase superfamily)